MRKIYINGRFLTQAVTGVQRYATEVVRAIDLMIERGEINNEKYTFILVSPANTIRSINLKHIEKRKVGIFRGHLWEQLELPFVVRDGLLVSLCQIGPVVTKNQIVVMHDASVYAVPFAFSRSFRAWYKLVSPILGARAQKIVTVSEFSKMQIMKYCRIQDEKISVAYEGKEHIGRVDASKEFLAAQDLKDVQYLLAVSSMNPNKNFSGIVKALRLLRNKKYTVVIAGGTNPRVFGKGVDLPANIKHVGYVSDSELKALYESACGFIYPSFYEGFGLPPIEAMGVGCPVIVSDIEVLREVCGDAVLYCDPASPQSIANTIDELMTNENLRYELSACGLKRVERYSWENCARSLVSRINETYGKIRYATAPKAS